MGEPCMGTPAISDGTLFFRCRDHVFAVTKTKEPRTETKKDAAEEAASVGSP